MALVRLELELDSEVYPELHAAVAALRSEASRAERLRQLATAGLVWENVRIHGAAAIGPTPAPVKPVRPPRAAPAPVAVAPPVVERPAPAERRSAPRPKPAPRAAEFVDLAIDAEPEPRERRRARATPAEPAPPARDLPVLMDVVTSADGPGDGLDGTAPWADEGAPVTVAAALARIDEAQAHAEAAASADPPSPDEGDEALHLASLAQKPNTRSRLMRMKERGLFKNG